jgi:hypothetical protein
VHKLEGLLQATYTFFFLFTQEAFGVVYAYTIARNKREQIVAQCGDQVDIYVVSSQKGVCKVQILGGKNE